jgi:hypothetical protein
MSKTEEKIRMIITGEASQEYKSAYSELNTSDIRIAEKSAKALTDKFYILEKEGAEQKIKECIHLVVYGSVFNGIGQKEAEISLYLIQLLEGER